MATQIDGDLSDDGEEGEIDEGAEEPPEEYADDSSSSECESE